jgi:hypothetical protein
MITTLMAMSRGQEELKLLFWDFLSVFLIVMIFLGNRSHRHHDTLGKRQRNGQSVTVTAAPLHPDTVCVFTGSFSSPVMGEPDRT